MNSWKVSRSGHYCGNDGTGAKSLLDQAHKALVCNAEVRCSQQADSPAAHVLKPCMCTAKKSHHKAGI